MGVVLPSIEGADAGLLDLLCLSERDLSERALRLDLEGLGHGHSHESLRGLLNDLHVLEQDWGRHSLSEPFIKSALRLSETLCSCFLHRIFDLTIFFVD